MLPLTRQILLALQREYPASITLSELSQIVNLDAMGVRNRLASLVGAGKVERIESTDDGPPRYKSCDPYVPANNLEA